MRRPTGSIALQTPFTAGDEWPLGSLTVSSGTLLKLPFVFNLGTSNLPTPNELSEFEIEDVNSAVEELEEGKAHKFQTADQAFEWMLEE